jgi:hypothetical protein
MTKSHLQLVAPTKTNRTVTQLSRFALSNFRQPASRKHRAQLSAPPGGELAHARRGAAHGGAKLPELLRGQRPPQNDLKTALQNPIKFLNQAACYGSHVLPLTAPSKRTQRAEAGDVESANWLKINGASRAEMGYPLQSHYHLAS